MTLEIDTHTHTIVSGHAYSTLNEMAQSAAEKGLKILATTDHGPSMPGGAHPYHFHNLRILPETISGVRILKGIEANIVDYNGSLDMPDSDIAKLELVIASFHEPCIKPAGKSIITDTLLKVLENKNVHILGHPEDRRYAFDYENVIKMAKESNTLIEINNSSLLPTTFRENCREGIINLLEVCAKVDAKIVLGSDAHHSSSVGRFDYAVKLIEEIKFPKNLIINRSSKDFLDFIGLN